MANESLHRWKVSLSSTLLTVTFFPCIFLANHVPFALSWMKYESKVVCSLSQASIFWPDYKRVKSCLILKSKYLLFISVQLILWISNLYVYIITKTDKFLMVSKFSCFILDFIHGLGSPCHPKEQLFCKK